MPVTYDDRAYANCNGRQCGNEPYITKLEERNEALVKALAEAANHECGYPWAEHICPDTFDNVFETLQRQRENPIPPPPPCDHPDRPEGKPLCRACWDVYRPEFEAWFARVKNRAAANRSRTNESEG